MSKPRAATSTSRSGCPNRAQLDPRQERRLLSTAIHSSSSSSSSAAMPECHTARSDRQGVRVEGGAERHQASSPAQTRRCLPSCTHTPRPSDARSAAAAPRAPPYGRGKARRRLTGAAAERPISRCGGSSHATPTLAPRLPAPAYRLASTHSCPPSRRAGRSYHPRPPAGWGAAAPSSLPSPVIHQSFAFPSVQRAPLLF